MDPELIRQLELGLSEQYGSPVTLLDHKPCAGGDINQNHQLTANIDGKQRRFFAKINTLAQSRILISEHANLAHMHALLAEHASLLPACICSGETSKQYFLILEYLDLQAASSRSAQIKLADALGILHSVKHKQFGWIENNFIGFTLQKNQWRDNWSDFWLSERFEPQWRLAHNSPHVQTLVDLEKALLKKMSEALDVHQPEPSLCHGDLWSGNAAITANGDAVLYDPACYFGDPETDIAMTKLFGGFDHYFYSEYERLSPASSEYELRIAIYQLYHMLNHLNMFGASYLNSVRTLCEKIIWA